MTKQFQKEITILHEVKQPVDLPVYLVAKQPTFTDAIKLCVNQSIVRRTLESWGDVIGCSKGYVWQVLHGTKSKAGMTSCFNLDQLHELQVAAGNWAVNQWIELRSKGLLDCQTSKARQEQLEAELAQLKAQQESVA